MTAGSKRYLSDHPEHRTYREPWEHRPVEHQYFSGTSDAGAEGFPVVVFDKQRWIDPTKEQLADYERRTNIVNENGGFMPPFEHDQTPRFTQDDRDQMIAAALAAYPEWKLRTTWNGDGWTFSVSLQPKEPRT